MLLPNLRLASAFFKDESVPAEVAGTKYDIANKQTAINEEVNKQIKLAIFAAQGELKNQELQNNLNDPEKRRALLQQLIDGTFPKDIETALFKEEKVRDLGILGRSAATTEGISERKNLSNKHY